jgi:hypothetical protein
VRALVPLEVVRPSSPEAAARFVARVRPLAAVRELVPLEVARPSSPVLAARLVARVRPLATVRALVLLEGQRSTVGRSELGKR